MGFAFPSPGPSTATMGTSFVGGYYYDEMVTYGNCTYLPWTPRMVRPPKNWRWFDIFRNPVRLLLGPLPRPAMIARVPVSHALTAVSMTQAARQKRRRSLQRRA